VTRDIWLERGAWAFLVGFIVHNLDHARRGLDEITEHVVWAGTVVAMMAAVILTLVCTRHAAARIAATVGGIAIAVGVSASHLLPEWSAFSDSLVDGRVDVLTWIAVLAEIAGAIVMSAAGFSAIRSRRSNLHPV
jgi:hypothetical protein